MNISLLKHAQQTNSIPQQELFKIYGQGLLNIKNLSKHFYKHVCFIDKQEIPRIEEYCLSEEDYCRKHNYVSYKHLINLYGTAWVKEFRKYFVVRKNKFFINKNFINKIENYCKNNSIKIHGQVVSTRAEKVQNYCAKNNCVLVKSIEKECCKRLSVPLDIKIWKWMNYRFVSNNDAQKLKEYLKMTRKDVYKNKALNIKTFLNESGWILVNDIVDKYGRAWIKSKVVPIQIHCNKQCVKNEDYKKIKEWVYKKASMKITPAWLKAFCEDNDCTPRKDVIAKYGWSWVKTELGKQVIKHKRFVFVPNKLLSIIEEMSLSVQEYCKKYKMTQRSELIKKYGQGWTRQHIVEEFKYKNKYSLIKNKDIPRIKEYASKSLVEHTMETRKKKVDQYLTKYSGIRVDELFKKYGQAWYKADIVPIEQYCGVSIVPAEYLAVIENFYDGRGTKHELIAKAHLDKLNKFCKENNCTPTIFLKQKYGYGNWRTDKELNIEYLRMDGRETCVRNEDIPRIEKYIEEHKNWNTSVPEKQVLSFIKSIYKGKVISQDQSMIRPFELDIYLPDKKLAIEFNGTYWHNEHHKPKDYHYKKWELCNNEDIHLIQIYEWEWKDKNKRKKLKTYLNNLLKEPTFNPNFKLKMLSKNTVKCYCDDVCLIDLSLFNNYWKIKKINLYNKNFSYQRFTNLIKMFIKKYKPSKIIYVGDLDKLNIKIFNELNFATKNIFEHISYVGTDANVYKYIDNYAYRIYNAGFINLQLNS